MRTRGNLFRKTFIICVVMLVLANVVLLGLHSFFGKQQYIQFERERLGNISNEVQNLYEENLWTPNTFIDYLDTLTVSNNISYLVLFPADFNTVYVEASNMPQYQRDKLLSEYVSLVIGGEELNISNLKFSKNDSLLCTGRPLYINGKTIVGCVFLVMEIAEMQSVFTRLSSSLWISALCLIPILLVTAYVTVRRIAKPLQDVTDVARQLSKGNYGVRTEESYSGEIGILARTMNNMSEALEQTVSQLEYEKRQLGYILSSFSEGVAAIDQTGKLTHFNPALMRMFGVIDAREPIDLVPDRMVWDAFDAVLDSKEPRTLHYNLQRDRVLWITIVPVMSEDNRCIGAVGLFKDATEIEQLERMRNDYVANISHELRTPLTSLRGLLEPLSDNMIRDEETRQRYYSIMLHEVERLSRLITDMLQLSRLQSGTESMNVTLFDIHEVIDDVLQGFQQKASQRNVQLAVNTQAEVGQVMSDRDRIQQVLLILVDNALRYAKSMVKIIVAEDAHDVSVSVWDDGCGIKEEDLPRLFERFFKADTSRKEGGTGLGLSIAKQIMDQLEETIEVESVQGEWTCFRFTVKKYVSNAIPLNSVAEIVLSENKSESDNA